PSRAAGSPSRRSRPGPTLSAAPPPRSPRTPRWRAGSAATARRPPRPGPAGSRLPRQQRAWRPPDARRLATAGDRCPQAVVAAEPVADPRTLAPQPLVDGALEEGQVGGPAMALGPLV